MINLRISEEDGINKFHEYIQNLKSDPRTERPELNQSPFSCEFQSEIEIDENKKFSTRMEMAEYLQNLFENADINRVSIIGNRGLWTWLAYIWFDQICPVRNGNRKVRETAKYICSSDYTDYYRHYVASTYDIFSIHGQQNSKLFLSSPVYIHNDFIEQLASRQNIIRNKNLIEVTHRLYWNNNNNKIKRGSTDRNKIGNLRRLSKLFSQLELTYDIYCMTADEILNLLPEEFNRWINP